MLVQIRQSYSSDSVIALNENLFYNDKFTATKKIPKTNVLLSSNILYISFNKSNWALYVLICFVETMRIGSFRFGKPLVTVD